MLGISLAIISFVGLESISQAAQETQRPASIIPRTSIALILTILIFALAYSNLALGHAAVASDPLDAHGHAEQFWQIFPNNDDNQGKAVALLANAVPYFGAFAALYVPMLGAILLLISRNSGVFGSSRIAYAMSSTQLASLDVPARPPQVSHARHFDRDVLRRSRCSSSSSPHYRASSRARRSLRASLPRRSGLDFLGDLYAFGAATSYSFVFIALIALRLNDPLQSAKVQDAVQHPDEVARRTGRFPIVGVVGFLGIFSILVFTMITHAIGRDRRPAWIVSGIVLLLHLPPPQAVARPPVAAARLAQASKVAILRNAGELELMDEYIANNKAADERRAARETVTK